MQQPSAIKVNWSDKLLIPRVVDNWEKSRVIFRKQANFIPLFPPCMDADNSIWKGNTVRTWFSSPGQDPWRKKTKPFYCTRLRASDKFDSPEQWLWSILFPLQENLHSLESTTPTPGYRTFHTFITKTDTSLKRKPWKWKWSLN